MAKDAILHAIAGNDAAVVIGDSKSNSWRVQADNANNQLAVTNNGTTIGSFPTSQTATATAGAATLNALGGVVTSESLSTAAGGTYTLTLTDSFIAATSRVFVSIGKGTDTTGVPTIATVTPGSGSVAIVVQNIHASAALNGTITFMFWVLP